MFMTNLLIALCIHFLLHVILKGPINNIPKSIALWLRRICNSEEKFDMHSDEYQNYLIARDYNISLVTKQFHSVRSISRSEARQVQ